MKSTRTFEISLWLLISSLLPAGAQSLTISQVDAGRLLSRQEVGLYLSVVGADGNPVSGLDASDVKVFESTDGEQFVEMPITGIRAEANEELGVAFFLLVDNSGSMYDTLAGRPTTDEKAMRITHVRSAIRAFLNDIRNPNDRVGIASFNTFYTVHVAPTREKGSLADYLDEIERPDSTSAYTELYAAIVRASADTARSAGRRVLIVLSDGENYPIYERTGEAHPEYGTTVTSYEDAIEECRREGTSVFAVNFGGDGDSHLWEIAQKTGGLIYDAADESQLASVYRTIRERVLTEYRVSYRASVAPSERRYVRAAYDAAGIELTAEQLYYASSIFGQRANRFGLLFLIPLIVGIALWWALTLLRFTNRRTDANLEVLGGKTQIFPLEKGQTVIGPSDSADVTIAGHARRGTTGGAGEATVLFDEKSGSYTVVAPGDIRVNNQLTKRRKLEPGDVINLDGTIIVFDENED